MCVEGDACCIELHHTRCVSHNAGVPHMTLMSSVQRQLRAHRNEVQDDSSSWSCYSTTTGLSKICSVKYLDFIRYFQGSNGGLTAVSIASTAAHLDRAGVGVAPSHPCLGATAPGHVAQPLLPHTHLHGICSINSLVCEHTHGHHQLLWLCEHTHLHKA